MSALRSLLAVIVIAFYTLSDLLKGSHPTTTQSLQVKPVNSLTPTPRMKSERERAIEGFSKRYAELISEGDDVLADFIADQAFKINAMSDEEFEVKYKDPIA